MVKKGKLFIDLGIQLTMPEGESERLCDDCGNVHPGHKECEGRLYDEEELATEDAIKVLDPTSESLEKVKKMLGREEWTGTNESKKDVEEDKKGE